MRQTEPYLFVFLSALCLENYPPETNTMHQCFPGLGTKEMFANNLASGKQSVGMEGKCGCWPGPSVGHIISRPRSLLYVRRLDLDQLASDYK